MTAQAVSHLLNCLFASCPVSAAHIEDINSNSEGGGKKKKGKKKQKNKSQHNTSDTNPAAVGWQRLTNEWREVTPETVWKEVEKRARSYFKTDLEARSIGQVCETYKIQKVHTSGIKFP